MQCTFASAVSTIVSLCEVLPRLVNTHVHSLVMRAMHVSAKGPNPVDSDNVININTFVKLCNLPLLLDPHLLQGIKDISSAPVGLLRILAFKTLWKRALSVA